jgi:hypothetical protein
MISSLKRKKSQRLRTKAWRPPFTEEEVKDAIFGSYSDGALGPDGFLFLFLSAFLGLTQA